VPWVWWRLRPGLASLVLTRTPDCECAATLPGVRIVDQTLNGVVLLEPTIHEDDRGSFYESYNHKTFQDLIGFNGHFVQENLSTSIRGVLRGIHYQLPKPQGKLVRCIDGAIWDVAVDLRRSSPTFRSWKGYELTAENRRQLWIPVGFGHGFIVVSESAQVLYGTTELWDPDCDRAVRWDDPEIAVQWPHEGPPLLSDRDIRAPSLADADVFD
jgi:dTDP-4-dehydrorhamnose 3,5-epimerase